MDNFKGVQWLRDMRIIRIEPRVDAVRNAHQRKWLKLLEKLPVSQLQEILIKHDKIPVYELFDLKGPDHARSYQYRVTVQDVMTVGTGSSKQQAKHAAAKAALDKIGAEKDGLGVATTPVFVKWKTFLIKETKKI